MVSSVSSLVSLSSDVDVIFYEIGEKGAIARTNAAGHSLSLIHISEPTRP